MSSRNVIAANLLLLMILMLGAFSPHEAAAQSSTPDKDENCIGCHENLYYLHDTGKWYCLCSLRARCTFCHGGNPDSVVEDEAHLGLVSHPTKDDAEACQSCHPDDFETRVEAFATLAGINTEHPDSPALHTARPAGEEASPVGPMAFYAFRKLETWQQVGIGIIAVLAVGVIFFGYCCWRFDCCNKSNNKSNFLNR